MQRNLVKGFNLDAILCIETERTLRNDFTVAHNHKLYQIEDRTQATKVIIHDRIDGSMVIWYQYRAFRFKEITSRPVRESKQPVVVRRRRTYTPPADHPWRRNFKFGIHRYERGKPIDPKT